MFPSTGLGRPGQFNEHSFNLGTKQKTNRVVTLHATGAQHMLNTVTKNVLSLQMSYKEPKGRTGVFSLKPYFQEPEACVGLVQDASYCSCIDRQVL